jgi:tetratricopeptide (TPR) repeat protein
MKTNTNIDSKNLGELLKSYYQGKLSDKELQDFESLKAKDDFLTDAMEGFDEFPEAIGNIPSFKTNKIPKVWISLGALAILSLMAVFMLNLPKSEIENTTITQVIPQEKEKQEEIVEIIKPEITEKEIVVPVTKIKQKKERTITPKTIDKEFLKRDYFEIPKMELNPIEIKQKTDYTIKKAKTKALLYYDFLAIDYSVIYTNTIPVKKEWSGIEASKANETENGIETGNGNQQRVITYKEQLKNSLFQLKEQNYARAIENFEIILTHFPQDANAEFYIGYALFYQKNYEKAIRYFDKAMTNGFDFFFEDAQWFKANSLEYMGKLKDAQALYRKIKNKGGYYSYQVR